MDLLEPASDGLDRSDRPEPRALGRFVRLLSAVFLLFGIAEAIAGVTSGADRIVFAGIASWTFVLWSLAALAVERRGRPEMAVGLVFAGVVSISAVVLDVEPDLFPAFLVLWILTLALPVPYLEAGGFPALFAGGGLFIAVAAAWHEFVLTHHRFGFRSLLPVVMAPAFAGFALFLLAQFRARLTKTLREIRAAEDRHRLVVDSALDAVITMDERGVITGWNPQAERTFGWSAREAMGRDLAETVIPAVVRPEHRRGLQHHVETGTGDVLGRRLEVIALHRDQHQFPVELSISATRRGDVVVFTGFVRDITDRRRLEREQQQLTELLVRTQDEERQRIADSIHDDPVQQMTAVGMRIGALRGQLRDPEQLEAIERLERSVVNAVARLRRLMFELHPRMLDQEGVASALREFLRGVEPALEYSVEDHADVQLSDERRILVYRIAQEALANVTKHAAAARVDIRMVAERNGLLVTIEDDGVGFDPEAVAAFGHVGLVTMRERAELSGGWCRVESSPAGTKVTYWVPPEVLHT
jgi:PAS domain S-box-containing protein